MPKLTDKLVKQTDEAESSSFDPIPDGVYHVKLRDVDATRSGPKGPYWSWEFEIVEPPHAGRRLWNNTSLSKEAAFKMKETFEAFGVPADTDTDDIIGDVCKAVVSQRTIQSGARQGQVGNQIDRLSPKDEDFEAVGAVGNAAGGKKDDLF